MSRLTLLTLLTLGATLTLHGCCCPSGEPTTGETSPVVPTVEVATPDETPPDEEGTGDSELEPGPCPTGTVCEDGCTCTCVVDGAGLVIRKETDRGNDGSVEAIDTHTYNEQGWLMRSEEDGGLWDKKARIDGTPDLVWVYTYDATGNRLQHEVFDAAGKRTTLCRYKNCPPPHSSDVCYKALKCN